MEYCVSIIMINLATHGIKKRGSNACHSGLDPESSVSEGQE
jgi:hypothetical protein